VLSMIEWRWDLQPLTERDAHANNLALALDFSLNRQPPKHTTCPPARSADHAPASRPAVTSGTSWVIGDPVRLAALASPSSGGAVLEL
jgi:hypothetical protein